MATSRSAVREESKPGSTYGTAPSPKSHGPASRPQLWWSEGYGVPGFEGRGFEGRGALGFMGCGGFEVCVKFVSHDVRTAEGEGSVAGLRESFMRLFWGAGLDMYALLQK